MRLLVVDMNCTQGWVGQVVKAPAPRLVGNPQVSCSSPSPLQDGLSGFVGFTLSHNTTQAPYRR